MAYNPYNIAGTQTGILEDLIQSEQLKRKQNIDVGSQKVDMKQDFEEELAEARRKQEEALAKKKKKNPLGSLLKFGSMFLPGLGPAISGAILGMADLKGQEKFAKGQIDLARQLGLDESKYKGTFLGSGASMAKKDTDAMLDQLYESADVSSMDMLTKGVMSGLEGKAMGDFASNITSAFKPKVQMGYEKAGVDSIIKDSPLVGMVDPTSLGKGSGNVSFAGATTPDISKLNRTVLSAADNRKFIEKLLEGLDFDFDQVLGEDAAGKKGTENLLALLQYL